MLREIVLDTETTGVDHKTGDRVIEIGCVELLNHVQTGAVFHCLINPTRPVSQGAFAVHGISDAMLADKPVFADVLAPLLAFIGSSRLVIHNAPFDVGFLNAEFGRLDAVPAIELDGVIDTLQLARRRHPGASNSLDALCARYGIDTTRRVRHGALLDAQMLAEVYVELLGGKQQSLGLSVAVPVNTGFQASDPRFDAPIATVRPVKHRTSLAETERHAIFVESLGVGAIWRDYANATR